jgi:putative permease
VKSILPRETIGLAILCILGLITFSLIFYVQNLLISLVLAFVLYYLLLPFINICERRGMNRSLAIFMIYTLNSFFVISLFYIFIPLIIDQLSLLEDELPELQTGFLGLVDKIENRVQSIFHLEEPLFREKLSRWMITQTSEYTTLIPKWISDSLTTLFLTPFLAFFMLRDGSQVKRQLLDFVPNRYFETSLKLLYDMNEQVGNFIRARLAEALIVGLVTWVGLWIIGFPYAALLALFAAITNLIPYIGPVIGAVPAFIILFVNSDLLFESMSVSVVAVSSVYLIAHAIDAIFIIPIVVAKIVNLHPVTVIVVIILGAQLLGVLGMIISIPMASLIKLLLASFYQQTLSARQSLR